MGTSEDSLSRGAAPFVAAFEAADEEEAVETPDGLAASGATTGWEEEEDEEEEDEDD